MNTYEIIKNIYPDLFEKIKNSSSLDPEEKEILTSAYLKKSDKVFFSVARKDGKKITQSDELTVYSLTHKKETAPVKEVVELLKKSGLLLDIYIEKIGTKLKLINCFLSEFRKDEVDWNEIENIIQADTLLFSRFIRLSKTGQTKTDWEKEVSGAIRRIPREEVYENIKRMMYNLVDFSHIQNFNYNKFQIHTVLTATTLVELYKIPAVRSRFNLHGIYGQKNVDPDTFSLDLYLLGSVFVLGKVMIAQFYPEFSRRIKQLFANRITSFADIIEMEEKYLGFKFPFYKGGIFNHTVIGSKLLEAMDYPDMFVDAVFNYHTYLDDKNRHERITIMPADEKAIKTALLEKACKISQKDFEDNILARCNDFKDKNFIKSLYYEELPQAFESGYFARKVIPAIPDSSIKEIVVSEYQHDNESGDFILNSGIKMVERGVIYKYFKARRELILLLKKEVTREQKQRLFELLRSIEYVKEQRRELTLTYYDIGNRPGDPTKIVFDTSPGTSGRLSRIFREGEVVITPENELKKLLFFSNLMYNREIQEEGKYNYSVSLDNTIYRYFLHEYHLTGQEKALKMMLYNVEKKIQKRLPYIFIEEGHFPVFSLIQESREESVLKNAVSLIYNLLAQESQYTQIKVIEQLTRKFEKKFESFFKERFYLLTELRDTSSGELASQHYRLVNKVTSEFLNSHYSLCCPIDTSGDYSILLFKNPRDMLQFYHSLEHEAEKAAPGAKLNFFMHTGSSSAALDRLLLLYNNHTLQNQILITKTCLSSLPGAAQSFFTKAEPLLFTYDGHEITLYIVPLS